ncbi:MAG: radical SAM protein [bacterium]|nr:radical SAM protein [bacterium]
MPRKQKAGYCPATSFLGYEPLCTGELPAGCRLCLAGRKATVFVTGRCTRNCFYCPVSREDRVYVNGLPVQSLRALVRRCQDFLALGAGITGGEPLLVFRRTLKVLRALKQAFGEQFHVHLYTGRLDLRKEELEQLAGLVDELRVHPPVYERLPQDYLAGLREYFPAVGLELPALPARAWIRWCLEEVLPCARELGLFVNLNELEFTQENAARLLAQGFKPSFKFPGAVKGSRLAARLVLERARGLRVHFCPVYAKDFVQLAHRNIYYWLARLQSWQAIDYDGTLLELEASKLREVPPGAVRVGDKWYVHPKYRELVEEGRLLRWLPPRILVEELPVKHGQLSK